MTNFYCRSTNSHFSCTHEWSAIIETPKHEHACERESSVLMANYPDLVDTGNIIPYSGTALNRLSHFLIITALSGGILII